MATYENPGAILATYRVNYMFGLPNKKTVIRSIQMYLTQNGFLFKKRGFDLYIPYNIVCNIELVKGSGTRWSSNPIWDHLMAKLFEISFLVEHNYQIRIRFEMYVSSAFVLKNSTACEDLMRIMRNNGIFEKFIPSKQANPSPDIITQIERLGELHKSGFLTDEEFQNKKVELLKKL